MKLRVVFQILCLVILQSIYASDETLQSEEDLFFQRIEKAYHQSDDEAFFSYVYQYINTYPDTENLNRLYALTGDVFYRRKEFKKAVQLYEMVTSEEVKEKVRSQYLSAKYELESYEFIIDEVTEKSIANETEERLLFNSFKKVIFDKTRDVHNRYDSIQQAISVYESLPPLPSRLKDLASYYFMLQKFSKAAALLRKAALFDLDLQNKEEILFQLSNIQVYFSYDHAMKTLDKVCSIGGKLKSMAAYNKLVLSFKKNYHGNIIQEEELYRHSLQQEHVPFLHYALGVSYLFQLELSQAEDQLLTFLSDKGKYSFLEEDALFYLEMIANQKNGMQTSCQVQKRSMHPNLSIVVLPEYRQLEFFVSSKEYEKDKSYKKKEQQKKELVIQAGDTEEKMLSHFELALFYFDQKNWKQAKETFDVFVKTYSECSLKILAWDYLIKSSVHLSQSGDEFAKAKLIYDLETFLKDNEQKITVNESFRYRLLLAKVQYQAGAFEEAIETAQILIDKNPPNKILSKCFILMAHSYRSGFQDQEKFAAFMKLATDVEPEADHSVYLLQDFLE